ncbi:MAG: hypothetical protein CBR30_06725 [Dictyoglomus sp. NZ13-RE01]|nr:MAG: hypothetical protein CBR30_06725 [Dictyoglomus sp. NZ13-RE01]
MIFGNLDELIEYLNKDRVSRNTYSIRFPTRLIMLSNYKLLHELINKLNNKANVISIGDILLDENEDRWLTQSNIYNLIKNLDTQNDFIILGISEFLRFFSDNELYSFINFLLEIEGSPERNRRIYIPLIGMRNRIENAFLNKYHRRFEWDPLWIINDPEKDKVKIYLVNFNLEDANIRNTKDYLNLWKKREIPSTLISCSDIIYYFADKVVPDETFDFIKIENIKEYIEKVWNIKVPIEYEETEDRFWKQLFDKFSTKKSNFNELAEVVLNIKTLKLEDTLYLWHHGDEFSRWILKWYILNNYEFNDTYTSFVLKDIKEFSKNSLITDYWLKIFSINTPTSKLLNERRSLLRNYYSKINEEVPKFIDERLEEEIEKLPIDVTYKYLVGISKFEKKWIIKNLDHIYDLSNIYPELSYYLEELHFENINEQNNWIIEYFNEYRASRLRNSISDRHISILNEKNNNSKSFYNWYFSFDKLENIYFKEIEKNQESKKIFIDGLGLEFLNLFLRLLKEEGYTTQVYIGTSELPSITKFNKLDADESINDLDKYLHDQNIYKYPENIIEEIEIIKNIVKKVSSFGDDLIIFSDHGFTPFASYQFNKFKRYNFEDAEHEGRYMEITSEKNFIEDEDFFLHTSKDKEGKEHKYIITLKYASLSDVPKREVHGGATPEEILVPLIHASKKLVKREKFEVHILKTDISIRNPILEVKIKPKPKVKVKIEYSGRLYEMNYNKESDIYSIKLENIKVGNLSIKIKIGEFEKPFEINIIGGMKERDIL